MRPPQMTTRLWMIAAAVVALACAAVVLIRERSDRLARIAREHSTPFPPLSFADLIAANEPERQRLSLWSQRVAAWHGEMARKYQYAARHPWLPVGPDPPEPER
jgi:hypothetical protein